MSPTRAKWICQAVILLDCKITLKLAVWKYWNVQTDETPACSKKKKKKKKKNTSCLLNKTNKSLIN